MITFQGTRQRADLKLTPDVLARIRHLSAQGVTHSQLAERFGVAKSTISCVINRRKIYAER